jgi:hypothetical protein
MFSHFMISTPNQSDLSPLDTKSALTKRSLGRLMAAAVCGVLSLWALGLAVIEIASRSWSGGLFLALPGIAWMLAAILWWRGGRTMLAWFFIIIAILLWDSILASGYH